MLNKNKGTVRGTVFQSKKMRNFLFSDQNGGQIAVEACSVPILSSGLFTDMLAILDHVLMCSCKNTFFLSCFLGENVKQFFSRVAALAFEQSMIKELENSAGHMAQIGTGNLISMFCFLCVFFLFTV